MKLTTKIALFMGITILTGAVILGYVAVKTSGEALRQEAERTLTNTALEASQRTHINFSAELNHLEGLANFTETKTMDLEIQRNRLENEVERTGYMDLGIVDLNGTTNYVLDHDATAQLGDRDYVKRAFDGESNISNVIISRVINAPVVMHATPIISGGEVYGALIARRDGVALNVMTNEIGYGDTGYAFIIGGDGTFYAHPNEENVLEQVNIFDEQQKFIDLGNEIQQLGDRNEGVIRYILDNEVHLGYIAPIEGTNWLLGVGIEESEALQGVYATRNNIILVVVVVIVVGVIAGVFFAKKTRADVLNKLAIKLQSSTVSVASASNQLSSASHQLAEGSTEQAASIEETSATIEQTTSMIKQTTENTRQASALSEKAYNSTKTGTEKMTEMNQSMEEIKKSSDDIAKIIKVIDEIAFQTNILALNAAVEAARAGDAGAGFAVVAEEVRNLAGRSAKAAKDTAAMIERNINLSGKGVLISGEVGKSLEEINENVDKVSKLVSEITAASEEQSKGVEQISRAMSQIEQVTQQNAAVAQESSASSQELQSQAEDLRTIVAELNSVVNGSSASGKAQYYSENKNVGGNYKNTKSFEMPSSIENSLKTIKNTNATNNKSKEKEVSKESGNSESVISLDGDEGF